jgi:peptide/nickel transport system substrate-binding protein
MRGQSYSYRRDTASLLRRPWSRRRVLTVALGGSAFLVACGQQSGDPSGQTPQGPIAQPERQAAATGPAVKTGGRIVTIVQQDPTGLDPHTGQGGGDHQFFWTMFDNLVNYNQKGELDPAISLAESWEIVDGTRINLKLRPNVKFHDGTPFNAEAVKFNIERVQDERTRSSARAQILPVTRVETPSETAVSFILDRPNAALLTILGDRGGAIVSPASVQRFGAETGRNPVGTGPFRFKEWVQGSHIVVTKNPEYWGKDSGGTQFPYIDELRWNLVPDPTVGLANLEAGSVDIVTVDAKDYDRVKASPRFAIESFIGSGWSGVYVNQSFPPMDDLNARRALGMSIDKAAVTQAVTLGQAPVGIGPITPASWAFNASLKGLNFNLDEARKALAASKIPNGAKIEMITINTAYYQQHAELWKQMASKIGIDLDVKPITTAELTQRTFVARDVPLQLAGFSMRTDPDGIISETLHSKGFYNPGRRENPRLDDLIDRARQTYKQDERKALYDQIQQIAIDEVYDYFIFYGVVHAAAPTKVKNLSTIWGAEGKQRYKQIWVSA